MTKSFVQYFLCILFLLLPVSVNSQASLEEQSLQEVVKQYFSAFEKKDISRLVELWGAKSQQRESYEKNQRSFFAKNQDKDYKIVDLKMSRLVIRGELASMRVVAIRLATSRKTVRTEQEKSVDNFHFVREKGKWKIQQKLTAGIELGGLIGLKDAFLGKNAALLQSAEVELKTDPEAARSLIDILTYLGNSSGHRAKYEEAINSLSIALRVAQIVSYQYGFVATQLGLGNVYYEQSKYKDAEDVYRAGLGNNGVNGDPDLQAGLQLGLGNIQFRRADYDEARKSFERALSSIGISERQKKLGKSNEASGPQWDFKLAKARTLNNLGVVEKILWDDKVKERNYEKGQNNRAGFEKAEREIEKLRESVKNRYMQALDTYGHIATGWVGLSEALVNYLYPNKASESQIDRYLTNLESYGEIENVDIRAGIANTLVNLSNFFSIEAAEERSKEKENYKRAILCCELGRHLFDETGLKEGFANASISCSRLYRQIGILDKAQALAKEAIQALQGINAPETEWKAHLSDAFAKWQLGDKQGARKSLEQAIKKIESIRQQQVGSSLQWMPFFTDRNLPYRALVDLLTEGDSKDLAAALTHAEGIRARTLSDILQAEEKNNSEAEIQPFNLDQVGQMIPDEKTALLIFVVNENKSHLFVLSKDLVNKSSGRLSIENYTIKEEAGELTKKVGSFRYAINNDGSYEAEGEKLYQLLFGKTGNSLSGKTRWIIIPDGPLWELPFQALRTNDKKYLIQKTAISYALSLTALREIIKAKSRLGRASNSFRTLFVANPSAAPEYLKTQVGSSSNLEETEKLAVSLRKIGNVTTLSKINASERRVAKKMGSYDLIFLAAHGILNNRRPMESHVILAEAGKNSAPDMDGRLTAREIYLRHSKARLKAETVVLMSCDTARGYNEGEGVTGLTWAFLSAGCPNVIAGQFKVPLSTSTKLMETFIENISPTSSAKGSKANALQQAMITAISSHLSPREWAGFILIGDGK